LLLSKWLILNIIFSDFDEYNSDIAAGMTSIQDLGIIHYDLKSANVLLEQVEISSNQYMLRGSHFLKVH